MEIELCRPLSLRVVCAAQLRVCVCVSNGLEKAKSEEKRRERGGDWVRNENQRLDAFASYLFSQRASEEWLGSWEQSSDQSRVMEPLVSPFFLLLFLLYMSSSSSSSYSPLASVYYVKLDTNSIPLLLACCQPLED